MLMLICDIYRRVKELEVEAVQAGNLLRSMEINEDNAAKSQSSSSTKVQDMNDKVAEVSDSSVYAVTTSPA